MSDNKSQQGPSITPRPIEAAPKDGSFVLVWLPITEMWAAGEFQKGIGFKGHYIGTGPWEEPELWIPMLPPPDGKNA